MKVTVGPQPWNCGNLSTWSQNTRAASALVYQYISNIRRDIYLLLPSRHAQHFLEVHSLIWSYTPANSCNVRHDIYLLSPSSHAQHFLEMHSLIWHYTPADSCSVHCNKVVVALISKTTQLRIVIVSICWLVMTWVSCRCMYSSVSDETMLTSSMMRSVFLMTCRLSWFSRL